MSHRSWFYATNKLELYCISAGPDIRFETQWLKVFNYVITADCMYWQDSTCFFTVRLTPPQWELCSIYHSAPHTSLSKHKHKCWQDIGVFAYKYQAAHDWTLIEQDGVFYSPSSMALDWPGEWGNCRVTCISCSGFAMTGNNNQTQ